MMDAFKPTGLVLLLTFANFILQCDAEKPGIRDKKFFSLFSVVQFPNSPCSAIGNGNGVGTCFSSDECSAKRGTVIGNCASGFGVCCSFVIRDCGATVRENCTFIENQAFPTAVALAPAPGNTPPCTFFIQPSSVDICQVRVDFERFNLRTSALGTAALGPPIIPPCVDTLTITTGSGVEPPILCGSMDGQHIFLETGRLGSAIPFNFAFGPIGAAAGPGGIIWRMKISQLECGNACKAPEGCLQYFLGLTGNVRSFNFGPLTTGYIYPMIYQVCIRRELGYCSIDYTEALVMNMANGMSGLQLSLTTTPFFSLNGFAKNQMVSSFLIIPRTLRGAYGGERLAEDLNSGPTFLLSPMGMFIPMNPFFVAGMPGAVTAQGPDFGFMVVHNSGFMATGPINAPGFFNINYRQQPC